MPADHDVVKVVVVLTHRLATDEPVYRRREDVLVQFCEDAVDRCTGAAGQGIDHPLRRL